MESSSRIGTELGGYRIDAVLGWGGTASSTTPTICAPRAGWRWTCWSWRSPPTRCSKRRFVREARKAAKLEHPNIVPLYAVGELDGHLYTAARYVDGDDLRALVRREGPLTPARALFILQQAAHALDAAREAGIPHRAVDSEAILVERHSDHVYVSDFGLGQAGGPALVPALGMVLEEMLAGQDVPLALDAVLVTAAAGGKTGYASGAELVRAARTALRVPTATAETVEHPVAADDAEPPASADEAVPPAAEPSPRGSATTRRPRQPTHHRLVAPSMPAPPRSAGSAAAWPWSSTRSPWP